MKKLTQTQLRELLARYRRGLAEIYGPRLKGLYLFGSYARGDARDESDVDVLVVLDSVERFHEEVERTSLLTQEVSLAHVASVNRLFISEKKWREGQSMFLTNVREEAIAA